MPKHNKRRTKRVKNLIVVSTLSAVLLAISTYAWFIGLRTVHVSAFEVEIAGVESLLLSLDGKTFGEKVTINAENFDDEEVVYSGHSNSWSKLVPMSSIGEMDDSVSRMMLYEKASLTATPGGYRLLASRVNNYAEGDPEREGYIAFDLFIQNKSGPQYIDDLDIADEESIYLTVDSAVTVSTNGVKNTGIENSVRVAFAQIGRVHGETDKDETGQDKITAISCEDDAEKGITGICRTAQIWEPNDTNHVENAIKWYNKSCKKRIGAELRTTEAYEGNCNELTDGLAYPTYAINQPITSDDKVDIYDGEAYNTYTDTVVSENNEEGFLTPYHYFTDTYKYEAGTARKEFMSLAPNSITKVRVYIYLEGQDIDNYDFAQIGKAISINFGFTKQRFTEDDIDYNGPLVNAQLGPNGEDLTPPRVSIIGDERVELTVGGEFNDEGATAEDPQKEGDPIDLTTQIEAVGTVNTNVAGTYYITYKVTDSSGNLGTAVRTVVVNPES